MTGWRRRAVFYALWVLCVAGCVCLAVFPAFMHFIGGIRWELGVFTGWVGRMAWVKAGRP